jgi:dienelactone hydrolase
MRFEFARRTLLAAIVACAASQALAQKLNDSLREAINSVPVPAAGRNIVVTSFRPYGKEPFPWIVLSHGTAPSLDANLDKGRYRPLNPVREWTRRGYAVFVPMRRGYGEKGAAHLGDSYGSCSRPDFKRAGEAAAIDLLATVDWAKSQRDLDPKRWLLVGQSSGGFASIYAASKKPDGLVAVLAFSPGRGGDPDRRPTRPCASDRLAKLFASIAPEVSVPVLWFYAENDQYIGPPVQKLWFESFRAAGGRGELVVVPPFPEAHGHGVFPTAAGTPLWTAAVAHFYKSQGLTLSF